MRRKNNEGDDENEENINKFCRREDELSKERGRRENIL